jgi:hypothetical protein
MFLLPELEIVIALTTHHLLCLILLRQRFLNHRLQLQLLKDLNQLHHHLQSLVFLHLQQFLVHNLLNQLHHHLLHLKKLRFHQSHHPLQQILNTLGLKMLEK